MTAEKPKKKKGRKIMLPVLAILAAALAGVYLYADNRKDIKEGYNLEIETGGTLEAK